MEALEAGKIACYAIIEKLAMKLCPVQLGLGVKGGAFNTIFKKFMLGEVKYICPELLPILQQTYRPVSNLYFAEEPLYSK